jgi:hypothetical protein
MCYSVLISTDAERDLGVYNTALIRFEKDLAPEEEKVLGLMRHPHIWYVGSKSGCSCTFRHLHSIELGFGAPEDWYPEDSDEIEATKQFYDIVSTLVSEGSRVDCISIWSGTIEDGVQGLDVALSSIAREEFRFFENHHFNFVYSG